MPRLHSLFLSLGLLALLAGCQFQLPGGRGNLPGDVTPNAVTGGEIEVTALDAPAAEADADAAQAPAADPAAQPQSAPPADVADPAAEAEPVTEPAPQPDLGQEEGTEAAPATEAEVAPAPPKSESQLACERKKGQWSSAGGKAHVCIFRTKDAGKSCTRGTQCEGDCLARSGTCSPIRPLLGCNEILQDDGARVTLCIE